MKEIKPLHHLNRTIAIPGSKSITHRAIIAASLAKGDSLLKYYLKCEDTLYTANTLQELGANLSFEGENLRISGTGGSLPAASARKELYLGNSGTSFRLLASVVALGHGEFIMTGSPRMLQRPIGALVTAMNQVGVKAECIEQNACPPVLIKADGIRGGKAQIAGNQSSQYLSSLLLSGPYTEEGIEIEVMGELVSRPYVDITLDVMEQFGVQVERKGYRYFKIPPGQGYQACVFTVQGDASSASYFWAAAAVTGGTVITENVYPFITRQGDVRFLDILERMGCRIEKQDSSVIVRGGALSGIEADMSAMPDMVPTLAAVALFSSGTTQIKNVAHLRIKESDRLHAVALEWNKLGARVEETDDGLIIPGSGDFSGAEVDPHDDHRIAMSLAVMGLRISGIKIRDEECVSKSFPRFWEVWDQLA